MPRSHLRAAGLGLACLLLVCGPAAAAGLTGRVRAAPELRDPAPLEVTLDAWTCGEDGRTPDPRLRIGSGRGIRDVVVTVETEDAPPFPAGRPAVLDQQGCVFVPHVLLVAPGQEILVRNDDGVFHNVRSEPGRNRPVNRGQPSGVSVKLKFTAPEQVRVGCDVHYWMSAVVAVAPHAYTAVTDSDGAFRIDGLSPGRYTVELWHETLGTRSVEVSVTEEKGGAVDFVWPAAPATP